MIIKYKPYKIKKSKYERVKSLELISNFKSNNNKSLKKIERGKK